MNLSENSFLRKTSPESGGSAADAIDLDIVLGLLSNRRRRQVLAYLLDCGGDTTIGEMSEQIAASENGIPVERVTSTQRKRVYVALYQCHLSKMDDVGVIDYDRDRGTVVRGPHIERACNPFVDAVETRRDPRSSVAIAAVAGGVVTFAILAGLQLVTPVAPAGAALVTAVVVCVTGLLMHAD